MDEQKTDEQSPRSGATGVTTASGTTGTQDTHAPGATGTTTASAAGTSGAQAGDTSSMGPDRAKEDTASIVNELQELGRQLSSTARTAWQSERRVEIQQEVTEGLRSLRDQLSGALDSVQSHPRTQTVTHTLKEQVDKVAASAGPSRASDVVDDVRGALASGLRELSDQLRRLTERLEQRPPDGEDESDPSATGPRAASLSQASQAAMPPAEQPSTPSGLGAVAPMGHKPETAASGTSSIGTAPGSSSAPIDLPSGPEGPAEKPTA